MKKTNGTKLGTKFKRFITGSIVVVTALLFAQPGQVLAGDTAQTITASDIADKTYGDAAFSVAATASSGLAVSYAVQGPARVNTSGSLTITGAGAVKVFYFQNGDATYAAAAPVVKSFTVNKATVTVTAADKTVTYDGSAQSIAGTATDANSNVLTVNTTYVDSNGDAVASPTAAGTYTATATVDDSNSSGSTTATLTISQAALTATLGSKSITYGGSTPTNAEWAETLSYSGFVGSDDSSAVTTSGLSVAYDSAVGNVGSYVATPSGLTATNYSITHSAGSLSVTKATATVAIADTSQTYNGAARAVTTSATDSEGNAISVTINATYDGAADAPSAVGSYDVVATISDNNYEGSASGALTVAAATVDVTVANSTVTYDGSGQSITGTATGVGGSALTVNTTYVDANRTAVTSPTNAGVYTATATVSDANHSGSATATLTINQAALTATLGSQSITYGDSEPSVATWATTLTYSAFAGDDTSAVVDASALAVAYDSTVGDVANYVATPSGLTASNYTITHAAGSLTVNKADTTVSLDALADLSYSSDTITLAATAAGNRAITYFVTGAATASGNEVTLTSAGEITVVAYVEGTSNYNSAYVTDTFTVSKAGVNVSMSDVLADYDGSAKSTTASAVDDGGNTLDVTINITYADANGDAVASPTNAGTYTATAAVDDSRYSGSQTATLTINKNAATVTIANSSHTHDGTAKSVTTSAVDADGNAITVTINTTYAGGADAPSAAGDYAVVSTISNDNYEGSANGTLTIGKVDLDVTATTYNGSEQVPALTLTPSDLSHSVTYNGSEDNPKNADSYTVVVTVNDDRYATTVTETYLIAAKPITVTADDASRGYGDENPTFAVQYDGFVDGEDASNLSTEASATSTAAATSSVGEYDIVPSGAVATNYSFAYENGQLTVTQAALTITPEDKSKTYLEDNPALTVVYSGFKNDEDSSVLSIQPTISTTATSSSVVGTYDITASGAVATNYAIDQSAVGTLTVNKKTESIVLAGTSQTYSGEGLAVTTTPSVEGLQVDVSYTDADGVAVASPTNAGSYNVSAVINDANYDGTQTGTLVIGKATATVTLGALEHTFDDGIQAASATTEPAGLNVEFAYSQGGIEASPINAGTYTVTGTINETNYEGSASSDAFVVGKAALTATADDLTKVYGSENPSATITYSGFQGDDTETDLDTAPAATVGADESSEVTEGGYDITLSTGSDNNYEITKVGGTLTVTKKELAVTAGDFGKIYGAEIPTLTATYAGFVNSDTVSDIDTAAVLSTTASATSDVGTYPTSAVGASDDNYSFSYTDGLLTVTQATASITISDTSQQYSGQPTAVTITTTPSGLEGSVVVKYDGSVAVPTDLGTYAVAAELVHANYTGSATGSLTIGKGSQDITFAHSGDVAYGVSPIDMGASADSGNEVILFVSGPAHMNGEGNVVVTGVGQVNVAAFEVGSNSWDSVWTVTSFKVTKPVLTVTADAKTKVYGDSNPELSYTITGYVNGEDESVLSTRPAVTTAASNASGVGSVDITFSTQAVDGSGNYDVQHVNGALSITKAPLTVTPVNQTRVYGDANLDGPGGNGLLVREYHGIGGTKISDMTGNAKYPKNYDFEGIAKYFEWPQTGDINSKPGNKGDNYGVELTGYITPTETAEYVFYISADDNAELWLSTDSNPVNLVKLANEPQWNGVRNFPTGDRRGLVDEGADSERRENVSKPIALEAGKSYYVRGVMKEGGGGDNFAVAWVKKGEEAPANGATPIPGNVLTPAGTIEYSYAGFKNDDGAGDLTTLAQGTIDVTNATVVGDYEIVIGGATSDNYEITHVNGTLTIGPATLTVTGHNKEVFETVALPDLTFNYSGFVNGEGESVITTGSSISTDADNLKPGDYPIVVSGTVAPNYAVNNVNGNMKIKTVAKPKVTGLSVTNGNALEGDKVTLTATATGDLLEYEWYAGGKLVEGETGSTLVVNDVSEDDAGRYMVFAKNFKGKHRKLASVKVSERLNQVFLVVGETSVPVQGANSIKIKEYHGIGGTKVADLTGNAKYPDSPDAVKTASKFESQTNVRNDYGIEASGYLHPKKTGDYTFYLATDDGGEVWLSTDEDPANVVKIAQETSWRGVRNYDQEGADDGGEAKSAKIALEGGSVYYIKVLMKEGGGGDNMALAWSFNDEPAPADGAEPIGGEFISQLGRLDNHPDYTADRALKALLESKGYSVVVQGPGYDVSDVSPDHMAFVVVSSSVKDGSVVERFKNSTAPIINLSSAVQDDLGFVGNDVLTGTESGVSALNIVNSGHALAGGLEGGTQEVNTSGQTVNWGTPNANATVIATIGDDADKAAIYGYEVGTSMGGGIAASARRVNLHATAESIGAASAGGATLINAAVDWVMAFDVLGDGGNLEMIEGESLVLDGRANGENIITQWYKDGVAIAGGATLDLGILEKGDSGTYTLKATDPDAPWIKRYKEVSYVVSVGERGPEAVLVTASNELTASESKIKSTLEGKGYYVLTAAAANTNSLNVEGKMLVVVSPSAAGSGEVVFENTASTTGAYFATSKEFGDQVELGLSNRLIDSLSFEYFGDFTADGDETAVARIYANDGEGTGGAGNRPGTLLYESDPFSIAPGFNSVTINGLLVEATDSITWTVDFNGVGDVEGNRAGLIFYNPPSVGSSNDDFWVNTNTRDVIYSTSHGTVYEAYYKSGNEFGDQIRLSSTSAMSELSFEAYAEISNAPSEATAKLRIYANDGETYGGTDTKQPSTLLFESGNIALKEGYHTYTVSGINADLPRDITWTVEFGGVTGDELSAGNNAALVLAGIDGVGSSQADFWQKNGSTWTTYVTDDANGVNDFSANVVTHSAGSGGWSTYTVANAEIVNNFGAKVTAGVEDDLLTSANVPMVVLSSGFQSHVRYTGSGDSDSGTASGSKITIVNQGHGLAGGLSGDVGLVILGKGDAPIGWGVPQGDATVVATIAGDGEKAAIYGYEEGALLADGNAAPERRSYVFVTDDLLNKADANALKLVNAAIDWTGGTGFATSPSGSELLVGESITLSATGYGPGDVTYQWKKNGGNIDGQTGSSLTLENVNKGNAGNYSVVVTSALASAEASADVKVFGLPTISLRAPGEGKVTKAVTHQVKIWALGGADKVDAETVSITINGVDVTDNAKIVSSIRGLQASVDLVENTTDTIKGYFLGYEDLAPGDDNAMQVTMSFEAVGGERVLTNQWSYTLYDATQGGDSDVTKMAIHQIFQRGDDLYVVWPGSPGLVLERNSDCKGGVWEPLPNTVGRGLHVEPNCGTQAFFRLVRVKE